MGRWDFEVTDFLGAKPSGYGVLSLARMQDRTVAIPYKGDRSFQFKMPLDHPRADAILQGDCLIKGYRTDRTGTRRLKLIGEPWTLEEAASGAGGSIQIAVAGPLVSRLGPRLLGTSMDGNKHGVGFAFGTPTALQDFSAIGGAVLDAANVNFTGVSKGTVQNTGAASYYERVFMKSAGEALVEISNLLGSFDLQVVPVEPVNVAGGAPTAYTNARIAQAHFWASMGIDRPNVLFEYGAGKKNASGYRRVIDRSKIANLIYHLPAGWPDGNTLGDGYVYAADLSLVTRGVREAVVDADITVTALRQALVDQHLAVRKNQRSQFFITPDPARNAQPGQPDYDADYAEGDTIRARAWVGSSKRADGIVRVYSANFTLGDQGQEAIELGLIPEGS